MGRSNFAWLFSGIMMLLMLSPFSEEKGGSSLVVNSAFTALLLIGVWGLRPMRKWLFAGLGLAVLNLGSLAIHHSTGIMAWSLLSVVSLLIFSVLSVFLAMRFVFAQMTVDLNHVMGAMAVYLLLGVIWALAFEIVRHFDPSSLTQVNVAAGQPGATRELLYFSFVTLTTLGYGDVTPATPLARNLALLEAIVGQLFIAVLIASLVGRVERPTK